MGKLLLDNTAVDAQIPLVLQLSRTRTVRRSSCPLFLILIVSSSSIQRRIMQSLDVEKLQMVSWLKHHKNYIYVFIYLQGVPEKTPVSEKGSYFTKGHFFWDTS